MPGNLFIKSAAQQTLEAFVQVLMSVLGCISWEERQSSNYVGERYFRCSILGLEVTIAIADDDEFGQFDFWMCIEAPVGVPSKEFLGDLADCIARQLTINGYTVIRPFNIGRVGSGAMSYRLNSTEGGAGSDRVLTEEI